MLQWARLPGEMLFSQVCHAPEAWEKGEEFQWVAGKIGTGTIRVACLFTVTNCRSLVFLRPDKAKRGFARSLSGHVAIELRAVLRL